MKKNIILLLSVLLILLIIPLSTGVLSSDRRKISNIQITATSESIQELSEDNLSENPNDLNDDEIDYILTKVLEYTDESTDTEALKAVIALCKNNFLFHKNTNSSQDEVNVDTYSDEFLEKLRNLYKDIGINLLYKGNCVYIPITKTSPGYIVTSKDYPYITSVACPWDKLSENYDTNQVYTCGISVNSIIYLCENGSDFTETLSWHLPYFDITN